MYASEDYFIYILLSKSDLTRASLIDPVKPDRIEQDVQQQQLAQANKCFSRLLQYLSSGRESIQQHITNESE